MTAEGGTTKVERPFSLARGLRVWLSKMQWVPTSWMQSLLRKGVADAHLRSLDIGSCWRARLRVFFQRMCSFYRPVLPLCEGLVLLCAASAFAAKPVPVTFLGAYDPDTPDSPLTSALLRYAQTHPEFRPLKWGGLSLPGAGGKAPFMLAMAGGTAPDVFYAWFHSIRSDIDQGFIRPLTPWLGKDGSRMPDYWQSIPPLWRTVATKNGEIYGLPAAGLSYYGIVYRKDLVRQAGLDPENPPKTWEEFYRWCQQLTIHKRTVTGAKSSKGQMAFGITPSPWAWLPWMQSAGGSPIVQVDAQGQAHSMEATGLGTVTWRAAFDSEPALAAARFMHRLLWAPWQNADGDKVIGVARPLPVLDTEAFTLGEVVAFFAGVEQLELLTRNVNIPPEEIGFMPVPSRDGAHPSVVQGHRHFFAMTSQVAKRPKAEQDLIFGALMAIAGNQVRDADIRRKAEEGLARWCNPADLRRLGLEEHIADIPPAIRAVYESIDKGEVVVRTEPFVGFWQPVSDLLQRRVIERLLSDPECVNELPEQLGSVTREANESLMFGHSVALLEKHRPIARVAVGALGCCLVVSLWIALARRKRVAIPDSGGKAGRWVAWVMLLPALASIALWSYWPLLRGALMTFQDYRIAGGSTWSGLDNIILVASDPGFWASVGRTFKFVGLTLALGFVTPVVLALMLEEIPRGKVFFRTIYFLPHLTSALVVTLLWRMMYDPTENGMLNQLLGSVGIGKQGWLNDPALAMVCCILPGVWAGAGVSSLIYGAALRALPPDLIEAAALDGAGFRSRLRHIILPQLLPLLIINFVGAFIAAFQGMGSIFLLTFGGPGDATTVLGLSIWKEAYNNLRFGTATTMAWFLGIGLIAFTWLQIRILRRVEYRRPDAAA